MSCGQRAVIFTCVCVGQDYLWRSTEWVVNVDLSMHLQPRGLKKEKEILYLCLRSELWLCWEQKHDCAFNFLFHSLHFISLFSPHWRRVIKRDESDEKMRGRQREGDRGMLMKVGSKQQGRGEGSEEAASHNICFFKDAALGGGRGHTLLWPPSNYCIPPGDWTQISGDSQRRRRMWCHTAAWSPPHLRMVQKAAQHITAAPGRRETCGESVLSVCSTFSSLLYIARCKRAWKCGDGSS